MIQCGDNDDGVYGDDECNDIKKPSQLGLLYNKTTTPAIIVAS